MHQRAIKEKDEEKRRDYWRMYFKAQHAEGEIREMIMEAEIRRLVEFLRADGYADDGLTDTDTPPSDDNFDDDSNDDDGILPRQKGFWDE